MFQKNSTFIILHDNRSSSNNSISISSANNWTARKINSAFSNMFIFVQCNPMSVH